MRRNGFVYLLCDPSTDLFKIGMTKGDVYKRIKKLQTGNSTEIHLVKQYETQIPFYIETSLHHRFSNKKVLNEWYDLNAEDIADFEKLCDYYMDLARMMQDNPFFKYKLN